MSSALPGFFKLSIGDRHRTLRDNFDLSEPEVDLFASSSGAVSLEKFNTVVENVVGIHKTPVGVATNFIVDSKEVVIPMANEEPSVIAGASSAAKLCRETGGFVTECGPNICSGEVVFILPNEREGVVEQIEGLKNEIISVANETMPSMVEREGGVVDIGHRIVETRSGRQLIVDLHVDVRDAMGANCVNRACERVGEYLAGKLGLELLMAILTNLSSKRLVHAKAKWPVAAIRNGMFGGLQVAKRIVMASDLASADPFRAATHRKGIMNGITSVVLATGNDTRAVESAVHSFAVESGNPALTSYRIEDDKYLVGEIWLPLPVGIVGGTIKRNPAFEVVKKLLKADDANSLARVMASVGLASNFAALRALVTSGICQGHMRLHSRNIACEAGATEKNVDTIAQKLIDSGNITVSHAAHLIKCNLV